MDINEERLSFSKAACEKIVAAGGYPAKVTATLDRAQALRGADGVLITILSGGPRVFRTDIEIPMKYGVDTCIGDTRGPSGIFRYLRTAPPMLEICRDIERYCPKALVLNYTNPMSMLCRTLQSETSVNITGLCHSVQGTAEMLAGWIEAPMEEITYVCAGINHTSFFLEYKHNGVDATERIREAILTKPDVCGEEAVRNEMFMNLDYYPTESSGHNSEYNAWFRKRPDLIEKYFSAETGLNSGKYAYILNRYLAREDSWKDTIKEWLARETIDVRRGREYAASIFNAYFGDNALYEFNGNVPNKGLVDNLPYGACVEVPVVATKGGLRHVHVGALPPQVALLVNTSSCIEELAVRGCIEGDKRKVFQAVLYDPLTSAVCSMPEIRAMVDEMFAACKDYLPQFKI